MQKIIFLIFLILTFICSCSESNKTASDWLEKEKALWDGKQYTDPEKAVKYLNNAIKLQPNNAESYTHRGDAHYNLGQYQRAIEDYTKAIGLKKDYSSAYSDRGNAYVKLSQYQPAIEDYNQAIRLKPKNSEAYNNRGNVYLFLLGNKELGCPDVQKACELGDCTTLEMAKGKGLCR